MRGRDGGDEDNSGNPGKQERIEPGGWSLVQDQPSKIVNYFRLNRPSCYGGPVMARNLSSAGWFFHIEEAPVHAIVTRSLRIDVGFMRELCENCIK